MNVAYRASPGPPGGQPSRSVVVFATTVLQSGNVPEPGGRRDHALGNLTPADQRQGIVTTSCVRRAALLGPLVLLLLSLVTGCPPNKPAVESSPTPRTTNTTPSGVAARVVLSAREACGPTGGRAIDVQVSGEFSLVLLVQLVHDGRVLASERVTAPTPHRPKLQLVPADERDHRVRNVPLTVVRARDNESGKLLAETPVNPTNRSCA